LAHNDSSGQHAVCYLDSGASNHLCGRKETFVELKEGICRNISLGDSLKLAIEGRGKVCIFQKKGKEEFISGVYYVPSMKSNILSIGQLLQKGYIVHVENNSLFLSDTNGKLIACVQMMKNNMFP
jgi:hypothetical protein